MSIVLVDAPSIDVTLVGASTPQSVQIVLGGLTPGQVLEVTGTAVGASWPVRGGSNTIPAETMILTDATAPLNVPIVYAVRIDGQAFTSSAITVPFADGRYVLQSLDGRTTIPFTWRANGDPRELQMRSAAFEVPGRPTPVARWDVAAGEEGALRIRTSRANTEALRQHLRTVGPVMLLRTDGQLRDLEPSQYLLIRSANRVLWDAVVAGGGLSTDRVWSLAFTVLDDPEPGVILPSATWDDFDAAYAGLTWDDFDAEWSGLTWDDFDRTDWSTR